MKNLTPPLHVIARLWHESSWAPAADEAASLDPVEIDRNCQPPAWMLERVQARHAVQQRLDTLAAPAPGVMLALERTDRSNPLTVLLRRADTPAAYWQAWFVATETAYASVQDYVLQEGDGLFDPGMTGMVQVWNPVRFRLPQHYRIIGRLEDSVLAAIESMATEYAMSGQTGQGSVDPVARPGLIGIRQTRGGHSVVTGTPLGSPGQDPRQAYQTLYRQLAGLLHEHLPWWQVWLDCVERFAADLNWACTPPQPVFVMGTGPDVAVRFERVLDQRLSVQWCDNDSEQALCFRLLAASPLMLEVETGGELEWRCRLSPEHPAASWPITPIIHERGATLILRDEQSNTSTRLELPAEAVS
jgi:hypothetical protein